MVQILVNTRNLFAEGLFRDLTVSELLYRGLIVESLDDLLVEKNFVFVKF